MPPQLHPHKNDSSKQLASVEHDEPAKVSKQMAITMINRYISPLGATNYPHKCLRCNRFCVDLQEIKQHLLLDCGTQNYQCPTCERKLSHWSQFWPHVETCKSKPGPGKAKKPAASSSTSQEFRCTAYPPCKASFTSSELLTWHMRTHSRERGQGYPKPPPSTRHVSNVHTGNGMPTSSSKSNLAPKSVSKNRQRHPDTRYSSEPPRDGEKSATSYRKDSVREFADSAFEKFPRATTSRLSSKKKPSEGIRDSKVRPNPTIHRRIEVPRASHAPKTESQRPSYERSHIEEYEDRDSPLHSPPVSPRFEPPPISKRPLRSYADWERTQKSAPSPPPPSRRPPGRSYDGLSTFVDEADDIVVEVITHKAYIPLEKDGLRYSPPIPLERYPTQQARSSRAYAAHEPQSPPPTYPEYGYTERFYSTDWPPKPLDPYASYNHPTTYNTPDTRRSSEPALLAKQESFIFEQAPKARPPSRASSYGSANSGVSHPPRRHSRRGKKLVEVPANLFMQDADAWAPEAMIPSATHHSRVASWVDSSTSGLPYPTSPLPSYPVTLPELNPPVPPPPSQRPSVRPPTPF